MSRAKLFRFLNIVLVSPSDVKPEREICKKVTENINTTLETLGRNYRVNLILWENVPPGAGRSNEHIGKYLDIEHALIVIGLFWYRFGTPPGATRPDDGVPYKSGTEEELEKAFYYSGEHNSPYIMMYWKRDKHPDFYYDEDYIQYARLIEFMRECNHNGRHPAYYVEFLSRDFEKRLSQDLLKVLSEIA